MVCCGFVGAAMLVPSGGCVAFFFLFVIGDFVWSGLRKKIEDLGWFFFFFFFSPPVVVLVAVALTDGKSGCGGCCGFFFR